MHTLDALIKETESNEFRIVAKDCPCSQSHRCTMHGDFCTVNNCPFWYWLKGRASEIVFGARTYWLKGNEATDDSDEGDW